MNRISRSLTGTVATVVIASGALAGQATQAPPMKSVLAGKKIVAPAKGEVRIEYSDVKHNRDKDSIETSVMVKNIWNAPVAGLKLNMSWFNDSGTMVSGNKGGINGVLQPGEVAKIVVDTPFKPGMTRPSMKLSHDYGTVKEVPVKKVVPDKKDDAKK